MSIPIIGGDRLCRGCGCTDRRACPGGCAWVLLDVGAPTGLCSRCADDIDWAPALMATAGYAGEEEPYERRA